MKLSRPLFLLIGMTCGRLFAQQPVAISDSLPLDTEGLRLGYIIKSVSEKEVGDKGAFSRYSIKFYATNTSDEAKIILYKQGFTFLKDQSLLAKFYCANATGARFTTKESLLQANECRVMADVEDKDCASGKTTVTKRLVQIGYWIRPNETISNSGIVIVPLNEKPKMTVTLLYKNSVVGNGYPMSNNNYNSTPFSFSPGGFVKLKNYMYNTYLNNQNGPVTCSSINNDWWSGQWQIIPVPETNYYAIQNRWQNKYLSADAYNGFLTTDYQSPNSMWVPQQEPNTNYYTLRNVGTNTWLSFQAGNLLLTNSNISLNSRWISEQ